MNTEVSLTKRTLWALLPAALLVLLAALPARALDKCRAKIKGKDGTIQVSAKDVQGALKWGNDSGQETSTFFNDATCVQDGKASKCVFGAEGTLVRITPPPGCTVYLDDGVGPSCSAYIRRCTPGLRGPLTCEELRGTTSCNVAEIVETVGNCTSNGGVVVGGACWFLGGGGVSCDARCAADGLVYDDATRFYAGSDGTNARCEAVLEALGLPADPTVGNPSTSSCGCYANISNDHFNRALLTTTSTCDLAGGQRACACK